MSNVFMSVFSSVGNTISKLRNEWKKPVTNTKQSECPEDQTPFLLANGWKVKIRHLRYFPNHATCENKGYYTRFGFDRDYPAISFPTDGSQSKKVSQYNRWVSTTGGRTEVELISPEGKVYKAEAKCSPQDNFSRREGRSRAVDRAYRMALAEQGM